MLLNSIEPGDMVFAASDIYNDGEVPGIAADALIAARGQRGVLVNTGHFEEMPSRTLYLVRFESASGELGMPVGVWAEELSTLELSESA
jgi:nitrogen fixation protein NifZ